MISMADYLFEVSWEVCNKVGGIYTVLTSKIEPMKQYYKNYFLIGPYFEQHAKLEFTEEKPPLEFERAFEILKNENIFCHYGTWDDVKTKPKVILIDFMSYIDKKNYIKELFWNDYKIDSLRGYWDFEEPAVWSYCVGKLIHEITLNALKNEKIVAQFHEWLSAFGLLYLKKNCKNVATVFTTHATVLGRTLSSNGVDLYGVINKIDPMYEAYRFNVEAKHLTERAAAMNSDAFTTVSEITGLEAERFLSRKPDVLLYNGLDIDNFPSFEDISIKNKFSKERLQEFLSYFYFPYYTFDMDKNLIFYTVGRFEYHNKGYDLLINALGRLNERLKQDPSNKNTISVFFWVPMAQYGIKMDVLENKNDYMNIKDYITTNGDIILNRVISNIISKKENSGTILLDDDIIQNLRKDLAAFERSGNPPFSTHNIDEQNNPVTLAFKQNGLLNRKEDLVKVVIEPVYLDGTDGFIDLTYYDALIGCSLGLFPSYYEPWGYTPLESVAVGVPALTTDLSGFGLFVKNNIDKVNGCDKDTDVKGVFLLERLNKSENDVINNFTDIMYNFIKLNTSQRVDCKMHAKDFSELADWKIFVTYYVNAHNIALKKIGRI
ncbi:MAG: glycosyltransferase [Candidatus Woesearchaeota archaeon]